MQCPNCQIDLPENAKFCLKCGTKQLSPCPNCGKQLTPGVVFCMECGTKLTSTSLDLTPLDEKIDQIQRYLPDGLTQKILSRKDLIEGERKQVTVLFCDLVGFTSMSEKLGPEETYSIMDRILDILIHNIHDYGGTVNQLLGDGLYALFGVPIALENGASRAIRAGFAIHHDIAAFSETIAEEKSIPSLRMRIGINSGPVVIGTIGNSLRVEFTAIGDTVNMASRMESLAEPGTIAVTEETYKRSRQRFQFESLGKKSVKGREIPVPVYKVLSETKGIHPQLPSERIIQSELVGREGELQILETAVEKAKKGEGSVVNVIGEAGIGKSRLIAEFKNNNAITGISVFEGRALSMGRNLNFYPIIEILMNLVGIHEEDSETERFKKLESAIDKIHPEEAQEIVPFMATLMGMPLIGVYAQRVDGIDGEAMEKLIYKNLGTLILRLADISPLILIFEDLHWADTSSIELIIYLLRLVENNRILIINIFRPYHEETGGFFRKVVAEDYADISTEIVLHNLNAEQSEQLINNLLDIEGLPGRIRNQIKDRSEGNPFFIEEMIRSMIDEGAIELSEDKFKITGRIENVVIPNTVEDLLMSRIDRLDEETRSLLKTASVIGRHFFYRILAEVAESIRRIDSRLFYLKEIQLIRQRTRMDEIEYLFKHALTQETAYKSILSKQRKELHRQVANAVEKIFNERLQMFFGMLAYHYSVAEDLEKTEQYMFKAGEEALKRSASNEALHYFRQSFDIYQRLSGDQVDPDKIRMLYKHIAVALYNKGQYIEGLDYLTKALEYHNIVYPTNPVPVFLKLIGCILIFLKALYLPWLKIRRPRLPTQMEKDAVELLEKRIFTLTAIDPKRMVIESFYFIRELLKFEMSQITHSTATVGGLSAILTFAGISFPLSRKIIDFIRDKVVQNDTRSNLYFGLTVIMYKFYIGQWYDVKPVEDLVRRGVAIGEVYTAMLYKLYHLIIYIEQGSYPSVNRIFAELKELGEFYDNNHVMTEYFRYLVVFNLKKRNFEMALREMEAGIKLVNSTNNTVYLFVLYSYRSRIMAAMADWEAAEQSLAEADKYKAEAGPVPYYQCNYLIAALILELHGLETAIDGNKRSTLRKHKKFIFGICKKLIKHSRKVAADRTETCKLIGVYYWLTKNRKKALKWFDSSIKQGERLGAKPELSRTYFEVGKRLLNSQSKYHELNGITAEQYLDKAKHIFEELDLTWDLKQLAMFREQLTNIH